VDRAGQLRGQLRGQARGLELAGELSASQLSRELDRLVTALREADTDAGADGQRAERRVTRARDTVLVTGPAETQQAIWQAVSALGERLRADHPDGDGAPGPRTVDQARDDALLGALTDDPDIDALPVTVAVTMSSDTLLALTADPGTLTAPARSPAPVRVLVGSCSPPRWPGGSPPAPRGPPGGPGRPGEARSSTPPPPSTSPTGPSPTSPSPTRPGTARGPRTGRSTGTGVTVGLSQIPRTHRPNTKQLPAGNLLECLRDREHDVLRFLSDTRVFPTNNISERGLRPEKTQQKISGRLTSEATTRHRLTLRSYLSTAAKHKINMMSALRDAITGHPWTPPAAAFS